MQRGFTTWMGVALLTALASTTSSLRAIADDESKTDPPPQVERDRNALGDGKASPRERVNSSFDRMSPSIGEMVPDVVGYDANGKEFRLRDLKGHHTVLVFGCLT